MQRYSGGTKVPRMQIESFINKLTGGGTGEVVVSLKYTPKSLGHIAASLPYVAANSNHVVQVTSLSGKDVTLTFFEYKYYHAAATVAVNSGGAGADPHSHDVTLVEDDIYSEVLDGFTVPAFGIVYEIG